MLDCSPHVYESLRSKDMGSFILSFAGLEEEQLVTSVQEPLIFGIISVHILSSLTLPLSLSLYIPTYIHICGGSWGSSIVRSFGQVSGCDLRAGLGFTISAYWREGHERRRQQYVR